MQVLQSVAVVVTLYIVASFCAWRAISQSRTPQGSVGWMVFLLAAPWFAIPTWAVFGHHKYRGYVSARRDSVRVVEKLREFGEKHFPDNTPAHPTAPFEAIAEMPVVGGNGFKLLIDYRETYPAIHEAIDAAEHYVLLQFYTIKEDEAGLALRDRLVAAAERGVKVRVLYDGVGSSGLSREFRDSLKNAGAEIMDPRASRGPTSRLDINFRNHRKTVVIDGHIGFIGGLNIGEEYMGHDEALGDWRDTHCRITGPVVTQLQLVFAEDWHWATGESLRDDLDWTPREDPENRTGLIVATGPGDEMDTGGLFYFAAIAAARERLWIASPYFVPDSEVLTALKHAAISGVDVRILLPEVIDHYVPWIAAFSYFDEVRAAGVQILRYQNDFMHQKIVLVDDALCAIGTTNLDNRSFRLNFEAMLVLWDEDAASRIEGMLTRDFENAEVLDTPLADQPWWLRFAAPIARLFAPIL